MVSITPEERDMFKQAASAFLATRERSELIQEQAADELGNPVGCVPVPSHRVEFVMAPGRNSVALLTELMRTHPEIPAFRFRGRVFSLTVYKNQVLGLSIICESEIEDVKG